MFKNLPVRRPGLGVMVTVAAGALLAGLSIEPAQAQWDPGEAAIGRCEQELQYQMSREGGGRQPDIWIDRRNTQVRNQSSSQSRVTGSGRFTRDNNDRGRDFTFDCNVNNRGGATKATYRWSGPGFGGGQYPDPGYDNSRPGRGGYPPNGRIFFSGGIVNRGSNMCLDVEGRSNRDAANVQQWGCSGGSNQLWDIIDLGRGQYSIVSQGSNKVLDVSGGSNRDGANIQQFRWSGGDNQRWRIERVGNSAYQIVNVSSGKCVDVEGARRDDGANVQQWTCSGGANQAWLFKK